MGEKSGAQALQEIRRLVFENRWSEAQRLVDQAFLGRPVAQLAYQPVGNLRLTFVKPSGSSEYRRAPRSSSSRRSSRSPTSGGS